MAHASSGDWFQVTDFRNMPMICLVVPWDVDINIVTPARNQDPAAIQQIMGTWMHERYPGAYCIGIQIDVMRAAWNLACVHAGFPKRLPGERLPQFFLRERWENHVPKLVLDDNNGNGY